MTAPFGEDFPDAPPLQTVRRDQIRCPSCLSTRRRSNGSRRERGTAYYACLACGKHYGVLFDRRDPLAERETGQIPRRGTRGLQPDDGSE